MPALDLQLGQALLRQRFDQALGELDVGNQRDAQVGGLAADAVIVLQLFLAAALGDVDDQVDAAASEVKAAAFGYRILPLTNRLYSFQRRIQRAAARLGI